MSEPLLKMRRGFMPYGDGSGYAVTVTIDMAGETSDPEIHIEMVGGIDPAQWRDLKAGIDTMLKGV